MLYYDYEDNLLIVQMKKKPYHHIKIIECGEPLLPIPLNHFIVENPPPYEKLGADYEGKSPYYLRQNVIEALLKAKANLETIKPGWKIKIFDAYRPLNVQQFMVDYTFNSICKDRRLKVDLLTKNEIDNIYQEVYKFWAIPNKNPLTPPPHSTGSAIDITLMNSNGNVVNMGGEIDEISERSHPNYYAENQTKEGQQYHQSRELLNTIMKSVGFQRHPREWWHFSLGDQMWAWLSNQEHDNMNMTAKYGKI
jgi:D-alanyl-D-alanine dipeptidase